MSAPPGTGPRRQPPCATAGKADKLKAELCAVMDVHPLTLLTLAYAGDTSNNAEQLLASVRKELELLTKTSHQ
jgi:hypothetical protein